MKKNKKSQKTQHVQSKISGWQQRLKVIANEIGEEYDRLSFCPPNEASTTVIYAENLITAINFLQRAAEMLTEHQEVLERHAAWEQAKRRSQGLKVFDNRMYF